MISGLKQQWIPVTTEKNISSQPQRFILLGMPLVIYRTGNKLVVLQDRCPHRGAPLSAGKLKDGVLECPYHGWRFNSAGHCIEVSGLVKEACLEDKSVTAYPTKIYLGLVFVCLELNEATLPLYTVPSLQTEGFRSHFMQFSIKGDILNIIENTLDATHTHFVHAGLLRRDNKRQVMTAKLKVTERCAEVYYEDEQKQSGILSKLFESSRKSSIGRFHFPLIGELEYYGKDNLTAAFSFFLSPIHDNEHRVFVFINYQHHWLTSPLKKFLLLPFIKMALKQDVAILTKQDENLRFFPDASFRSTELDMLRPHIERIFANKSQNYEKTVQMYL